MEEERSGEGVWRGMNQRFVGFFAFSLRLSRVELGPRFESAAPGIWHLASCICSWHLHRVASGVALVIWHLTFVIWRRGARNEEARDDQDGCNATLCVAVPRHAMLRCAMLSALLTLRRAGAMPRRRTRKGRGRGAAGRRGSPRAPPPSAAVNHGPEEP